MAIDGEAVVSQDAKQSENSSRYPQKRTLAIIVAGLMTGLLMGAMDQTIVATAGPTIISDLSGLSLYAWVFSVYILTQTISMPVFGKLSDLFGRRKIFLLGLVIFMGGSVLSGTSQNIDELIVFRAIQGVGSGAFFPVAIAVIGIVFPPAQRGRVQGIFASVFGIAAVLGPSLGSYLIDAINWRWIFYINLPLGIASLFLISIGLKESKGLNAKASIDWVGIFTLTGWIVFLLLGLLDGGSTYPWYSWQEAFFFAVAVVLFPIFLLVERKAKEPVVPLNIFRIRTVSSASMVAFLRGVPFYAIITFSPLFIQGALAGSVDDGRNVLYAFMLPMIAGTLIGGQLATKTGYRKVLFGGIALMTTGVFLFTGLSASSTMLRLFEGAAIMGVGIGITFPAIVLAIQFSVDKKQIGIASSMPQFMGNLGGTIGLAILGAIQTNIFSQQLSTLLQSLPASMIPFASPFLSNANLVGQLISTPQTLQQVVGQHPQIVQFIPSLRAAFAQSMSQVFWASLFISILALAATVFVTGSFKQQVEEREKTQGGSVEEKPTPIIAT